MARSRAHLRLVPAPPATVTPAPPSGATRPGPGPRPAVPGRSADHRTPTTPEPLWRELLGAQLRARRRRRGERLSDVAGRAGVSPQYLSEIERGCKEPSSEMIGAIGRALGTDLADLALGVAHDLAQTAAGRASGPSRGPAGPTARLRVA